MVKPCQLYQYNPEGYHFQEGDEAYFREYFPKMVADKNIYWLNYHRITDSDNISGLLEAVHLDKTLIDEIQSEFSRAKLEEFENYMYFKIKSVLPQKHQSRLSEEKLSFILGENYVLSFQERSSDHFPDVRHRIENKIGKIRVKGADFLLYKLLDAIVENYFEALEAIIEEVEKLDHLISAKKRSPVMMREYLRLIEIQKRRLIQLRKIVSPLRDVGGQIQRLQVSMIKKENRLYFSKINESCMWILEEIDANKQILEGLTNLYYSINEQRMNEVMRLLTVVSTIFIPLTFIVGVYGMNFRYMPELEYKNAYWIVWGIMISVAIGMIIYFQRKGWLKKDNR
ncbi:MAG: magnesium/cobalt transporter CorA [Flavobacteriia bacterium]|nr:magnesium/cobalt transporter CorA [Flavobacteriia bacterium]OJX37113.1 MAG: magnesium and cobalt transport protein CorA [Flavobacteriia bacterium 40-80]